MRRATVLLLVWVLGAAAARAEDAPVAETGSEPARARSKPAPEATPRSKSGFGTKHGLGPTSTPSALVDGDALRRPLIRFAAFDRLFQPWFRWKAGLNKRHRFMLGADYHGLYQRYDSSPSDEEAVSNIFRVFGEWTLLNRCCKGSEGSLVWKVEHRHRMGTTLAPQDLGFAAGYGGITGTLFNDFGLVLTNFYWKQRFGGGRGVVMAGQLDATDYLDVVGIANPFTAFQNLSVLLNPTIPLPNQGLGVAASYMPTRNLYVIAGLGDVNAVPTRDGFQTFEAGETFKHVEVGLTASKDQFFSNNIHALLWHQDQRDEAGVPEAWGITASGIKTWCRGALALAVRGGWSSDAAGLAERHAGAMLTYSYKRRDDVVGVGVGWDDIWGAAQEDQVSAELFWNVQIAKNLEVTPSVQWLHNPAFNPTDDEVWVFGFRWRLTL